MRYSKRRSVPSVPATNRSTLTTIAAMALAVAFVAPASADITLVSTPDGLVQMSEQVTISWAETVYCNMRYGRVPGTYTDETTSEGWDSLVFTPDSQGMSHGVYYCVVSEVGGGETSCEFVLIVDSPTFPSPTAPANGSTVFATSTTFQWDAVDGVPYYHLLLSDHEVNVQEEEGELLVSGANIIWQAITSGTSIQYGSPDPSGYFAPSNGTSPPLMSDFSYHWLIFNNFGNNPLLTSTAGAGLSAFVVDVAVAMDPPDLLFPPDSLLVVDEYLDFSWTPVDGAAGYHVYIYEKRVWSQTDASFPVWDGSAPTASAQVHVGSFLVTGDYQWRVVALDASGRGVASETRSFDYATETGTARIRTKRDGGASLPNVLIDIEFLAGGVNVLPAVTDGAGARDVVLVPGEYAFHASKPDYVDTTATAVIAADENPYVIITMSRAPARVRGVVEDEEGEPVFNADVTATSGTEVIGTKSDAAGNFVIQASTGLWEVRAEKPGYAPSEPTGVELHADDYLELAGALVLTGTPGTASGNVTNESGGPIVGVTILAQSSFGTSSAFTNASGHFSIELAPGEWTLFAEKSGFIPSDGRGIVVGPGENTEVEPPIVLTPGGSAVVGRVTDGRVGYSGARVVAVPPVGHAVETVSNSYGEFVLLLPRSTFELTAECDGLAPSAPHQVIVESGESYMGIELMVAPASCTLSGTVADGTDPVAGALVTNGETTATTSAWGEFALHVSEGLHELTASREGFLSGAPLLVAAHPTVPVEGLELEITGGASSISGRALCGGETVAGAVVAASSGAAEVAVVSGEDGGYLLHVEAGAWIVTARKDGLVPSSSELVTVAAGQSASGVDPELTDESATLEGWVTDSRDVLRRALVLLYRNGDERPAYRTSSDSDGRYRVRVSPGAAYTAIFGAPGHGRVEEAIAALAVGEERVVSIQLPVRASAIAGAVTGAAGLPLVGALVAIAAGGGVEAVTNAYGDYKLDVDAGLHDVSVSHPGYEPALFADVHAVAGTTAELDCELSDVFASLQGTVVDSATSEPVAGVLVTAMWGGGLSDVTGSGGDYELPSVVPGEIVVVATKRGFADKEKDLTLTEHESRDHDVDVVRLTGSISGQVTESSTGLPVAGVSVRARLGNWVASAGMTGFDGRYVLAGLYTRTTYDVHALRAGYSADSENPRTDVAPGAANIDFALSECAGIIAGHVLDGGDGEPLSGASVTADNGLGHFGTAATGVDGSFAIDALADIGNYDVTVSLYGYHDAVTHDVAPGGESLTLEMPRNFARLVGTLTPQGEGVELGETQVVATNIALAGHSRTAVPDVSGEYEIIELKPGSYVLSVSGGAHVCVPAQASLVVGEGESVSGVDFTVERAVIGRIDVEGPGEVEAGRSAFFSGSVFAQDERLVDADLEWWISPRCAGSVARATGEVSIAAGYIGEATVSAREPGSGMTGHTAADIYVVATPAGGASSADSLGMTLDIGPGAVGETKSIFLTHELLPDVMRNYRSQVVEDHAYHLKPCGMLFEESHLPTLTVPDRSAGGYLLLWDHALLAWSEVGGERTGDALESEIASLGRFAVGTPTGPLGVSDVGADPNPVAPDNGPVVISYELSSDDARMPFVTVRIYNMTGQFVREVVSNEPQGKGRASVEWDGLTDSSQAARNGRYVVEVSAEDSSGTETALGTVVLVK
ncbi:MAG: carboxypeptidase regulatory-like domain-containing protein [Candidatus Eisenbacteria bacterium]